MKWVKRRRLVPAYYDATSQKKRRIASHRTKRCGVCTFEVPEADITLEFGRLDGAVEVCPLCKDLYTAEWLASEEKHVATVKAESAIGLVRPPQLSIRPLTESRPAAITSITSLAGVDLTQSTPLVLVRNTAATVLVNGQYFSASTTFTYPSAITDNVAPIVTPTLITLSLIAVLQHNQITPGVFSLTVADGITTNTHIYTNIFVVV